MMCVRECRPAAAVLSASSPLQAVPRQQCGGNPGEAAEGSVCICTEASGGAHKTLT